LVKAQEAYGQDISASF